MYFFVKIASMWPFSIATRACNTNQLDARLRAVIFINWLISRGWLSLFPDSWSRSQLRYCGRIDLVFCVWCSSVLVRVKTQVAGDAPGELIAAGSVRVIR